MNTGGRPRDSVWQYFTKFTEDSKVYAKCNGCGNTQLAKAGRLKLHHEKCAGSQMDTSNDISSSVNTTDTKISSERNVS